MTMVLDGLEQWGGVPVASQAAYPIPIFGTHWFVDGTNGRDGNPGTSKMEPLQTIQAAVTAQIAYTTGLGDVIWIMPGTYAETVYAPTLTNVQLIGVGVSADAVTIAPTDGHALLVGVDESDTATMTNSAIRNMTFLTPSTSNATYAAMTIGYMLKSVVEGCKFKGTTITGYDPTHTIGLQIGNMTDTPWEFHEHSRISGCEFTSNAGRNTELGRAIQVGASTQANPEYKGFKSMIIEDCIISAYDAAIFLQTGSSSCNGSVIRRNIITSQQGGIGPDIGITSESGDGTDLMCMIVDNRITAIADCIRNFSNCNTINNITAVGGGDPADEYNGSA